MQLLDGFSSHLSSHLFRRGNRLLLSMFIFLHISAASAEMLTNPPISIGAMGNSTQSFTTPLTTPSSQWSVVKIALDYDASLAILPSFGITNDDGSGSIMDLAAPGNSQTVSNATVTWDSTVDRVITLIFQYNTSPSPGNIHWNVVIHNNEGTDRTFFVTVGHANNTESESVADTRSRFSYLDISGTVSNLDFGPHIIFGASVQNIPPAIPDFTVCNRGTGDLSFTSITASDSARFQIVSSLPTITPVTCTNIALQFTPNTTQGHSTSTLTFVYNNSVISPGTYSSLNGDSVKLELALALDISGSMGWLPDGSGGNVAAGMQPGVDTRLGRLKDAANQFVSLLYDHATESGAHNPSAATATVLFPARTGTVLKETMRPLADLNSTELSGLTGTGADSLTMLPIGNWRGTPMGEGIIEASNNYSTNTFTRHALLLFTDGAQNTGISAEDSSIKGTAACPPFPSTSADGIIQTKNIDLYPFGYGIPGNSNVDHDLLSRLSECAGNLGVIFADDPTNTMNDKNLVNYFNNILNEMLELQIGADPGAVITKGATNEHKISITEYDTSASFTVAWEPLHQEKLNTYLITPNGTTINAAKEQNVSIYQGNGYRSIVVRGKLLKNPENIGDWRLMVQYVQQPETASATTPASINYTYDAMLSSSLRMSVNAGNKIPHTGEVIPFVATLREKGIPIIGADVSVVVDRPDSGYGSWFADNLISEKELSNVPQSLAGEPLSLLDRKTNFLRNVKGIKLPAIKREDKVKLYDDATHGDKKAGDGIYTNSTDVQIIREGLHSFHITANGMTKNNHRFQRQKLIQKVAVVNLDPKTLSENARYTDPAILPFFPDSLKKIINSPVPEGFVRKSIVFVPKDSAGNYWGPGHADEIKFESKNAKALGPLVGILDGTYVQVIEYKDGITPSVNLNVQGVKVNVESGGKIPFWVWLLLLLLGIGIAS